MVFRCFPGQNHQEWGRQSLQCCELLTLKEHVLFARPVHATKSFVGHTSKIISLEGQNRMSDKMNPFSSNSENIIEQFFFYLGFRKRLLKWLFIPFPMCEIAKIWLEKWQVWFISMSKMSNHLAAALWSKYLFKAYTLNAIKIINAKMLIITPPVQLVK